MHELEDHACIFIGNLVGYIYRIWQFSFDEGNPTLIDGCDCPSFQKQTTAYLVSGVIACTSGIEYTVTVNHYGIIGSIFYSQLKSVEFSLLRSRGLRWVP